MTTQPGVRVTLLALLQPRRLLPIALVGATLVWAQVVYNHAPYRAPLALALCAAFVLVAPVSWRLLFHAPSSALHTAVLWTLYFTVGVGVVFALGLLVPRCLHLQATLLTEPAHLVVCVALFVIGGWGIGRHIALEEHLRQADDRVAQHARRAEESQVLALRAQLDPHFLFNTLNAIAEWCILDGVVAERAILQLSAMLRAVLAGVRAPAWSLREELTLVDALCELHRLRDPGLFELVTSCEADLDAIVVPPMLLLPLVENAIKHGPMAGHRGTIAMALRIDGGELTFELSNPGPYRGPRAGSEGLPTLERRLGLTYNQAARLSIRAAGSGTRVELSLPLAPCRAAA
ncbi:MAG: histidine kinase [Polyangia bacterium]